MEDVRDDGTHGTGEDRSATEEAAPRGRELRRLVVVCSGSINAAVLPWWIGWTRINAPEIELRIVVTRSAARFVSPEALAVISGHPTSLDVWPEASGGSPHTELVAWADGFVVYPASAHFLARLALGITDTPSQLALQCTAAPIAVVPALPPGMWKSAAMRRNLAALAERENVLVIPPVPGRSWSSGRDDASIPPPFPQVVQLLRRRLVAV